MPWLGQVGGERGSNGGREGRGGGGGWGVEQGLPKPMTLGLTDSYLSVRFAANIIVSNFKYLLILTAEEEMSLGTTMFQLSVL